MTGVAQPGELLGVAWQLPALLGALWLWLVVVRRELSPWYFVVTTGACSAVPLIAFFVAVLLGRTSGPQHGAGLDIPMWSFLSVFTGLGAVIVLFLLTGIVELVRLLMSSRAAPPNARSRSAAADRHLDSEVDPLGQPRPVL